MANNAILRTEIDDWESIIFQYNGVFDKLKSLKQETNLLH